MLVPVSVTYSRKSPFLVKADEHPRPETTLADPDWFTKVARGRGDESPRLAR